MRAMTSLLAGLLLSVPVANAWHKLPRGSGAWRDVGARGIRGLTIGPIESSLQPGRGYGTSYSAELLDELVRLGATWVSITPFGRIFDLADTDIQMDFEQPYEDNRLAVRRVIAQARERGLRVLVIPHLWVDAGGWRGEIDPGPPDRWARYRSSYRAFVTAWARDAAQAGADAFSIGVECKSWSGRFGGFWAELVSDVRGVFPGLLTYSANWDEAPDVVFWDQLDLIGINAFYPLAAHDDASYAEYVQSASRTMHSVRDLAWTLQMPVVFVEVGYTTRSNAAVRPWLWPDDMTDVAFDEPEQARALAAVLDPFLREPWFAGFFVWRYYANIDDVSQEAIWGFSPHAKLAEPLIASMFACEWACDPDGWP